MEDWMADWRYATRGWRRDPVTALAATLTLALCIGANTTVFSVVNTILLRPLPFPGAQRLYWLSERMGREQMEVGLGSDYYSLREERRLFAEVGAFDSLTLNWSGTDQPAQLDAAQVTPSFFATLGTQPMMGRYLASGEEGRQASAVVVLSYAFWRSRMGGDPHAVGKTITLDGMGNTVIGVMPQGFNYPSGTQVWRPLPMDESSQRPRSATRPVRIVNMVARLRPQVPERQLDGEMSRVTQKIRAEYPKEFETAGFLAGMRILATPLQRRITGDLRPALLVLSAAVALVLMIACANLANLLLARAGARQREVAVRMALGSGRSRVVRQMLAESLALALPGGLAGAAVAYLAVAALNGWKPLVLERYPAISMDVATLAFTFGLTLVTGLLFGMAPAWSAAGVNIQESLKAAGHTQSGGCGAARLRQLLVVVELGLSLVLLIGAGLLARSFVNLARTDLGFPAQNLLTLRVNLTGPRYTTARGQAGFYNDVLERMRHLPMVRSAALSTDLPLSGEHPYQGMRFQVAGRAPLPIAERPEANVSVVSAEFFRTLEIPLRSGRAFDSADTPEAPDRIVVNDAFARRVFAGEDALGQRIVSGQNNSISWTIVGVVGSIRASELGAEPQPLIYRCICQTANPFLSQMRIMARTAGDPRAAMRPMEGEIHAVDGNQPVFDVKTMEDRVADALAPRRFHLVLLGTFTLMAIILAALGVYGVMSCLVTWRTREIGIRMALGARPGEVERLVVGETVALAAAAAVGGLAGAWGLTRYLNSMLYGVTTVDAATFAAAPVLLAAVAIAASLVPARKAAHVDPVTALREE